jgi:prepilin peptidase CpaA
LTTTGWTYPILVIAGAILLRAAWTDLQEFKIRNELILTLAGLFVPYALLAGYWADLRWDIAFAVLMFAILLAFYGLGWMGGGDVKILAVAFLWAGLPYALPFALLLAVFSLVHGLAAKFGWAKSQRTDSGRMRIPFAPSVAGALICTFILRAMQHT